jgi:hypothetical protein
VPVAIRFATASNMALYDIGDAILNPSLLTRGLEPVPERMVGSLSRVHEALFPDPRGQMIGDGLRGVPLAAAPLAVKWRAVAVLPHKIEKTALDYRGVNWDFTF